MSSEVRRLTSLELLMDVEQYKRRVINPRVFVIDSKIDLFKCRDIFLQAISFWTKLHPLLQSRITTRFRHDHERGEDMMEKYFEIFSNAESFNNVVFFNYTTSDETAENCNDAWKLLFENEFTLIFDSENELLWRMKIVHIGEDTASAVFKYAFIFTAHHAITDGRNAYAIILELFEIIESVYLKKELKISDQQRINAEFERSVPNDPRIAEISKTFKYAEPQEVLTDIVIPDFLKPTTTSKDAHLSEHKGVFRFLDGSPYELTAREILSNRTNHESRCRFLTLDENAFCKLMRKAKEKNVKLTGVFEAILCIALCKAYHHFSNETVNLHDIKYKVTVGMRGLLDEAIDPRVMGVWMCSHSAKFQNEYDFDSKDFWSTMFWDIARKQSHDLHRFLNTKTFLDKEYSENSANQIYKLIKGYRVNDGHAFFAVTNIGQMNANSNGLIRVREYYSSLSYTKQFFWHFAFNSLTSIENKLFWCMSYNADLFRPEVIDYWVSGVQEALEKISN